MNTAADVIVVGAGIIGSATAMVLAQQGHQVLVLDAAGPAAGTPAAAMGHVVVMDDSEAQGTLTRWSQSLWDTLAEDLPAEVEHDPCGTLWIAADDDEMDALHKKATWCAERDIAHHVLGGDELQAAEPHLRNDLLGALHLPGDSVVYPPTAATWMLEQARAAGATCQFGVEVREIGSGGIVTTAQGRQEAGAVVCAAGERSLGLLPTPVPGAVIRPRKGHLAITARYPGLLRHEVVELGYLKSAHGHDDVSVAFNVQPRKTGQVLIGSSRQYDRPDGVVEPAVLSKMLARACSYLPALAQCDVVRSWTGFRAATPDNLPLIGSIAPRTWLATGHEGLGITTSLATAHLIADALAGRPSAIDGRPYRPDRFREMPLG